MRTSLRIAALSFFLLCSIGSRSYAQGTENEGMHHGSKNKVVFQVSDNDPKKWELTLNNIANVQKVLGAKNMEAEVVAYGPGIGMLKLDSSVGPRIREALENNVKIVACENTMHGQKLTKNDMLPNIGYTKTGVLEIMQKQQEGYAYVRP